MFEIIEIFSKNHEHTIAAIEAISTFSAVLVSLILALAAHKANQTHLEAWASISFISHDTIPFDQRPFYLTVNVTNTGIMPLMIPLSFFHWKLPLERRACLVTPLDYAKVDQWVPQQKYPVEIKPRTSHTFFLQSRDQFHDMCKDVFSTRSFIKRCKLPFLQPKIATDDGKIFRVTVSSDLQEEIKKFRRESKRANHGN